MEEFNTDPLLGYKEGQLGEAKQGGLSNSGFDVELDLIIKEMEKNGESEDDIAEVVQLETSKQKEKITTPSVVQETKNNIDKDVDWNSPSLKGSWNYNTDVGVDGAQGIWSRSYNDGENTINEIIPFEEVPPEILQEWEKNNSVKADVEKGQEGQGVWDFIAGNDNVGLSDYVAENIHVFKADVEETKIIASGINEEIEFYKQNYLRKTELDKEVQTSSSNLVPQQLPGQMTFEDPSGADSGKTALDLNTQQRNKDIKQTELRQRLIKDRNSVEANIKESRVPGFLKQAARMWPKNQPLSKRTDAWIYETAIGLMKSSDEQKIMDTKISQYIEDNQGVLEFFSPEWADKEVEKAKAYKKELETKQIKNLQQQKVLSDSVVAMDSKIADYELALSKIDYSSYEKQIEDLNSQIISLGDINESSNASDILEYNRLNSLRNEQVTNYKAQYSKDQALYNKYKLDFDNRNQAYQSYLNTVNLDIEFNEQGNDLIAYANTMNRNGNNVAVALTWVGSSALSMANGIEGTYNALKELPEDLLFKYYDNNTSKMPALVKAIHAIDGVQDAMRNTKKETFSKAIEDMNASVQAPTQYEDIENLSDLGSFGLNVIANFAPQYALMYATGGASIYIMGGSAFGNKYDEMEFTNRQVFGRTNYTLGQKWLASSVAFGSEVVSESLTYGVFKAKSGMGDRFIERVKNSFGKNVLETSKRVAKRTVDNMPYMYQESVSEAFAELGNNFGDKYVLGKDISLGKGLKGAALSGLFMERAMSMPALYQDVSNIFAGKNYKQKVAENNFKRTQKEKLLANKNLDPKVRSKIETEVLELVAKNETLMAENIENLNMMSNKEKEDLVNIDSKIIDSKATEDAINTDKSLDDSQKETLIEELREEQYKLEIEKDDIVKEYESEETRKKKKEIYEKQKQQIIDKVNKFNKRKIKDFKSTNDGARGKVKEFKTREEQQAYFNDRITEHNSILASDKAGWEAILKDPTLLNEADKAAIGLEGMDNKLLDSHVNQIKGFIQNIDAQIVMNNYDAESNSRNYGGFSINKDGGFEMFINKENSLMAGGRVNAAAHEFLHGVLFKSIGKDPETQEALGSAVINYVAENKGSFSPKFRRRMEPYQNDTEYGEEIITIMSESIMDGTMNYNEGLFTKFGDLIRQHLQRLGLKDITFDSGKDVYNFIKDYNASIENNYDSVAIEEMMDKGAKGKLLRKSKKSKVVEGIMSSKSPEKLIREMNNKKNTSAEIAIAEKELAKQYDLLALDALNYDTRKGDIVRENVIAEARKYLPGILKRFNPRTSKFSTYVNNSIFPKQAVIFEAAKSTFYGDTKSTDSAEARQIEDTSSQTTNTQDVFVQKIDILNDFAIANRVADKIKNLVKVVKGDNFKSIISKYAGKVGALIFEIPANKIMEGGANLTAVTKYTEGMPAPAEAQNIQRFFNAPNNADKFIKTLPLYNVTDKTADINKVGENLDVSRDTYGYAIGLKGLPLDYFYENYTDPTGEITSPKGRSKGLTSQTQVKRLKPQFRKPTPETVDQLKKDLGITPKNQANVYSRDIGQLLKGVAKVHSINAAISGAQRFLEAKTKIAPAQEQKALKQQTADITTAQSKISYSRAESNVQSIVNMQDSFDLETVGIDQLLKSMGQESSFNIKTKKGREDFINAIKNDLFPMFPRDFFFTYNKKGKVTGSIFTASNANYGLSMNNAKQAKEYNAFRDEIFDLASDANITHGKPIKGADFSLTKSYNTIFGKKDNYLEKMKDKKRIKKWNANVGLIHKEMWKRINTAVRSDNTGTIAPMIGTYLKLTANDKQSWHRLGAQLAGYSTSLTKREDGKSPNIEFEHAMPATAAYLHLLNTSLNTDLDFESTYDMLIDNYKLIVLDKAMDDKLRNARTESGYSLQRRMPDNWSVITNNWFNRYFNELVSGVDNIGISPDSIIDLNGNSFGDVYNVNADGNPKVVKTKLKEQSTLDKAVKLGRTMASRPAKGITVLDFDDTLATTKSLVKFTTPDGKTGTLNAEQFASTYEDLQDQGYTFDFSDFNKVVKGKLAPLFNKAIKLQGKFGPENMFVLTARPPQAQKAIFEFLKANGLNIPLKNITGLGNSTAEAKALWMADKVADGYNDFYFADDALQNVQAVKNMLDQFDVKSKVQQAKIKFSKDASGTFNDIIQETTGIESQKVFSEAQAKIRGAKSKYKSIIPPSAQDFGGLLYNFLGKGKKGEQDMAFFKKALIDPFARGINELNAARQASANDYENLLKQFPEVKKLLNKKIEGTDYTHDQAVRIYLWEQAGFEVPGLSKRDLKSVVDFVEDNSKVKAFADTIGLISKKEDGYSAPGDYWLAENIKSDLLSDGSIGDARAEFLAEWQQNADLIFSPENLNKIEAIYGSNFREALEDILYRMKTGRNRPAGGGRLMNIYTNWVNNSVGAIMFFNMRSALLQTISATNYINWSDNNPLKAAAAFANQKQYWSDFSYLFNSDYLKQRRSGNQRGINEAELSAAVAGAENKAKAAIAWLLKKGFLPTQIADSFAIASGGATFYRNRVKAYVKQGMSKADAEQKAFLDFQETTEVAQQSARPDMISQQQASPLGKLILAFQNTPMQYARIMNKAARDIYNGRGDMKTHTSKIIYYGFVQSIIFGALQSALFASLDDEDEEKFDKKKERILNGMVDSVLSGIGYGGKAVSTMKNTLTTFLDQRKRGFNADHTYTILQLLGFSPPIGSKLRKVYSSIQTDKFNKDVFKRRGLTLDNPIWSAVGNVIEGVTNVPLGRLSQKMLNIDNALDANNKWWQRVALVLGWNTWDLGIKDADIEGVKKEIKKEKKVKAKEKTRIKREEKKKEKEEANKAVIEENKKKSKKDGLCSAVSKSGKRCKKKAINGGMCTVHEKAEQNQSGKKTQCKHIKSSGKRCGMKTSSKSGLCYYHD